MADLLIRGIPDSVNEALIREAEQNRRSPEKQALILLESSLAHGPAETCGELLDSIWSEPAPNVDEHAIDAYLAERGRRSNRP